MESSKIKEEYECLCKEHIWTLETRIQRMEQSLEHVLEKLEKKRPAPSRPRFTRSHPRKSHSPNLLTPVASAMETVVLGQPGMTPVVPLHKAAEQGDEFALVRALCSGADPRATNQSGDTALHCAVCSGSLLAVELLLAAGALVDAPDVHGATPLAVAACLGLSEMVEVLLEKGAFVDSADEDGRTPLIKVVFLRDVMVTTLLVNHGASVNVIDRKGDSPLVIASRDCLLEILAVLMETQPLTSQMLQALCVSGNPTVFMTLIKDIPAAAMCSVRNICLPRAAKEGWERPVRALLANCVGVQCRSSHEQNISQAIAVASTETILLALWSTAPEASCKAALRHASLRGWLPALKNVLGHWRMYRWNEGSPAHRSEVDEALCVAGSEAAAMLLFNEYSSSAMSLLDTDVVWRAVEQGWPAILLSLMSHGAHADAVRDGTTLLHCAAARGHVSCVKILVEKGATTSQKDDDGWTPLHLAAEGGHDGVVGYLLTAGADPSVKDPFGLTPCDVASSPVVAGMLKYHGKSWD